MVGCLKDLGRLIVSDHYNPNFHQVNFETGSEGTEERERDDENVNIRD